MKQLLVLIASVASLAAASAHGQEVVIDPTHIALDTVNQVTNIAQYTSTELNTLNSYTQQVLAYEKQIQQYETQIQQLVQQGNPAALLNLAGLSDLSTMIASGAQVYKSAMQLDGSIQQIQNGALQLANVNPTQIFSQFQNGYGSLNGITLTGTTAAGTTFTRDPNLYVYPAATNQAANSYGQTVASIGQQQQQLALDIQTNLQNLQNAPDDATVQKYSALLAAQNAQMQLLGQQAAQAAATAAQQQAASAANQAAAAAAAAEQAAQDANAAETAAGTFFAPASTSNFQLNR